MAKKSHSSFRFQKLKDIFKISEVAQDAGWIRLEHLGLVQPNLMCF